MKKMFVVLLRRIVNGFNHTKCISLSNKTYMIQTTLVNLHPNDCSQEFQYYSFEVKLDSYAGWSCNAIIDLSSKVYIPNKTEDLNLSDDYMNKWIENISKPYFMRMPMQIWWERMWFRSIVDDSVKNVMYLK